MEYYHKKKIELISKIENDIVSIHDLNRELGFKQILISLEELLNILSINSITKPPRKITFRVDSSWNLLAEDNKPLETIKLSLAEKNILMAILPLNLLKPVKNTWYSNEGKKLIRIIIGIFYILIEDEDNANFFFSEASEYEVEIEKKIEENKGLYDYIDFKIFYYKSKLSTLPFHERINYAYLSLIMPLSLYYYNLFSLVYISDLSKKNILNKQYIWALQKEVEMDKEFNYPYIHCLYNTYYSKYLDSNTIRSKFSKSDFKGKLDRNWEEYLTDFIESKQIQEMHDNYFQERAYSKNHEKYIDDCYNELRSDCDGAFDLNTD